MQDDNGWDQYSKLVLKQLETLSLTIEDLRTELQDIKEKLAELRVREERIEDIRTWKNKVDEVVSPTQLSMYVKDIEELKVFKTKAVAVFATVQFIMAIAIAWPKLF
tara:strand:- start:404 stop:724 length:321 start_codon:yes stop_codon:yes gene_type:complete